jgi:uncharacterized membrane protein YkvA (DUF1232 family)
MEDMGGKAMKNETAVSVDAELARADRFYTRLRARVTRWLQGRGHLAHRAAPYLLLLPDLFTLLLRLIRDPRVGRSAKLKLLAVTAYVISPIDLIPDFLLPLGLLDDTIAIALVLSQVVTMLDDAGEEILREHWEGTGDVLRNIQRILGLADDLLGRRVVRVLRRRFGSDSSGKLGRSSDRA